MSYQRKQEDKRRLNKLYASTRQSCGAGAYYDQRKDRIIRYSYADKGRGRYLKRLSSRAVRRQDTNEDSPPAPGARAAYRRTFDYWWNLF